MNFFDDVYLKRINRRGNDLRSRIVGEKEHEFDDLFMKQTIYQVLIHKVNDCKTSIIASLQPNSWNESKELSNLLVSRKYDELKTGDLLKIQQQIGNQERDEYYLVLFYNENLTLGYRNYKLILLDDRLMITNEYGDTQHSIPFKIFNNESIIVNTFNLNDGGYTHSNRKLRCVAKDYDFLEKDVYTNYGDKGWEIAGFDNISIKGVRYITLKEVLKEDYEPRSSENILVGDDKNFFLNNR